MHIIETCCCGAEFTAQGFTVERNELIRQAGEFRKAHSICRERKKVFVRGDTAAVEMAIREAKKDS